MSKNNLNSWTDTHCHVNYLEDQEKVLQRSYDANVRTIVCISTKREETQKIKTVVSLGRKLGLDAYRSIGIHPLYCADLSIDEISEYLYGSDLEDVVAVGETGLDDFRSELNKEQIESFKIHLQFAVEKKLAVVMHTRSGIDSKVEETAKSILKEYRGSIGIAHCFNGSPEFADFLISLGWYISFSGVITYKKNEVLKSIAKSMPIDRILIETDSPFLPPQLLRGTQNEPANVVHVGQEIACLRCISEEECMRITSENACRIFRI
jgi:TatD DNase family protein